VSNYTQHKKIDVKRQGISEIQYFNNCNQVSPLSRERTRWSVVQSISEQTRTSRHYCNQWSITVVQYMMIGMFCFGAPVSYLLFSCEMSDLCERGKDSTGWGEHVRRCSPYNLLPIHASGRKATETFERTFHIGNRVTWTVFRH
jgi:hypothetical protein